MFPFTDAMALGDAGHSKTAQGTDHGNRVSVIRSFSQKEKCLHADNVMTRKIATNSADGRMSTKRKGPLCKNFR